ncbi:MAG: hypothetical protein WCB79_00765 [Halobacteriota archaeon]
MISSTATSYLVDAFATSLPVSGQASAALYNHLKATGKGTPVSTFFAVDSTGVGVGVAATARSGGVLS